LVHPHLLEISAWPWLERLSRDEGRLVTLGDVPASHWDRIAVQGFQFLYLMGVWRRSAIGRELARADRGLRADYDRVLPDWTDADVPGSPYCIEAYEPDERMGGWAGLEAARGELRARGVRLMLDFVPNHTAFDHAWIAAHPERYVLGQEEDYRAAPADFRRIERASGAVCVACGRDPHFPPWRDVAQLNYFNPDTRLAMQQTVRDIAGHCDGVRCDVAMLVLNDVFERTWGHLLRGRWPAPADDFWRTTTRAVHDLTYLAEVYWDLEGTMLDQGFDYAYDKRLLDSLHAPDAAARVRDLLWRDTPAGARLARFLENHDEPRSAATLHHRVTGAAALVSTVPGMRFFFDGQFEGRRIKPPVQLGRWPEEPLDPVLRAFYDRVLRFAAADLLHEGEWRMLQAVPAGDGTCSDIVAYRWRAAGELAVVAVNLGPLQAQAHLLVGNDLPPGAAFDFEDALTDARYRWTRDALESTGLYVRLEGGQAHLFFAREASVP
jgi:hypothetical protein